MVQYCTLNFHSDCYRYQLTPMLPALKTNGQGHGQGHEHVTERVCTSR